MLCRSEYALASLLMTLAACSSGASGGIAPNDAGTRADGSTTTGGDASTGAPTPAACEAQIVYNQRCSDVTEGKSQACADGRRLKCADRVATMSPAYAQAVVDCETPAVLCADGPDNCIAAKLADAPAPTTAMSAVRDHFCKTCPSAGCAADFFKIDQNNGNGPGYVVLEVSDALAGTIDARCTGANAPPLDPDSGITDCAQAFAACASDTQQSALPADPDACAAPDPGADAAAD